MQSLERGARAVTVFARVLTVAWYGLVAACGLIIIAMVALLALSNKPHVVLELPVVVGLEPNGYRVTSQQPGLGAAALTNLSGQAHFTIPAGFGWLALVVVAVLIGLVLLVSHQLRGLFESVAARRPFTPRNAKRVRVIGIVVIAGELGRATLVWAIARWLRDHFTTVGLRFDEVFAPRIEVLFVGVVIVLIAEVFHLGARLQEDHDLTI